MNAVTTAAGPLEKSYLKARKIETGGITAPTITAIRNTCHTFLDNKMPIEEGIIRYAKVNTSPTNLVVNDIPIPTTM